MSQRKLGVAIIGCGHIAERYAQSLVNRPSISLMGATDLDVTRSSAFAQRHNCAPYPSVGALLGDERVDLVVNLTVHQAHYEVSRRCLEADRHVYSEKPLALTYEEAGELVSLAQQRGLRLGCAPFAYMGEAQQTLWKWLRDNRVGTPRVAYAEINWGRIETFHPAPIPFYEVGVLFDVAVYPLTLITAMFGPARRVWAQGRVLQPDRVTLAGVPYRIDTPDFSVALIELESGLLVRLTASFYVGRQSKQKRGSLEVHGDMGSLFLTDWHDFDKPVEFAEYGLAYELVTPVQVPYPGVDWGRAVEDMAGAIATDRPHRATGEHAAHVVEIVCAINRTMESGRPEAIRSSFPPPTPMEWADR